MLSYEQVKSIENALGPQRHLLSLRFWRIKATVSSRTFPVNWPPRKISSRLAPKLSGFAAR
jgi:hypothetical protein